MVRDELYITVPSFFRCPISLDVMKSPVSLCTGVTYDRASIQRWLDGGNNTCPATMQVLQTKEVVPNRTLQRLIRIWAESVSRHRVDSSDSPVPSPDQVASLVRDLGEGSEGSLDSLAKIVSFARESEGNRKFLAGIDGFLALLVDFIGNVDGAVCKNVSLLEQAVAVVDSIRDELEDHDLLVSLMLKSDRDCLSSMLLVLQQGSSESRVSTARVLESIAIDAESKHLIAEKDGLLPELLKLISHENDQKLIEASLSCLVVISMLKRTRIKLVDIGLIKSLSKLLSSDSNSTVSVTEKVLKLLELASACKEGRSAISEDWACVPAIVQKLLKVSAAATQHAVTVLWSVCYLGRDQKCQEAVAKNNGLTKILLLMQSNCSAPVKHMSGDLLKIFRVSSKPCLSSYDTKTTHIMPF